jgi:hypothetical protein
MTAFYGHLPFSASYPQMGAGEGIMAQDMYGQNLPRMMPAEAMGQALQTSSYTPESAISPYAEGGRVQSSGFPLGGLAEALRTQGRHGDTMLAHISPEEAEMLEEMGGSGTINPETGLPEYFLPFIAPLVLGALGAGGATALGAGTLGAMAAGALAGGVGGMFGHPNQRQGFLKGSLSGGLAGVPLSHGATGLMQGGLSGALSGIGDGVSSMGTATGLGSLFGSGASATGAGAVGSGATGGGLGSFLSGNLLNNALLATAIGGTLLRREKPQGPQSMGEAMMQAEKHRWRADQYPDKNTFKPAMRTRKPSSKEYRPGFDPEEEQFTEDSPWQYKPRFAGGGFLEGESLGQEDNVPALLSEGEFVIPADVVADLGDGNSKAGAKRLEKMMQEIRRHKNTSKHPPKSKGLGAYFNA